MRRAILLVLLFAFWVQPSHGQDLDCDIDLTTVYTTLAEAQTALDNGDNATALTSITAARRLLEELEENCTATLTSCTVNSVDYCVEILEVTFSNGQTLKPGDVLNMVRGEKIRVESVTYALTNDNLQIISTAHGRPDYAYAYALPVVGGVERDDLAQATLRGSAVVPLAVTESNTLNTLNNPDWIVQSDWSHLVILIIHANPNAERGESPVGRAFIGLNVRAR